MSVRLVFIGAAVETVPAASLRALAGSSAVFVPAGCEAELRELVASTSDLLPEALRELRPTDLAEPAPADAAASVDLATATGPANALGSAASASPGRLALLPADAVICVAGAQGPMLARAVLAAAARGELGVSTVPVADLFNDLLVAAELTSLRRIVTILRRECPWDREQTAADIIRYTVEEVYELADAVGRDDVAAEHGELGDVLLQVYLLALFLEERSRGDLGTVAQELEAKLVRRHAHIFGDGVAETATAVREQWERIKREQEGRQGIFHDVPATLPALLYARKLQERAAAVGFDWPTAVAAFPKIAEEHRELAEVLLGDGDVPPADHLDPRLIHEFGDLLFATVNVARLAKVDPELALRAAGRRFESRVCGAAELARREDVDWSAIGLVAQEKYYQRAKAAGDGATQSAAADGAAHREELP
ncbi:MAG: nucleoside triphosphate pyrophosphohydrolase [Thermoleophilia bacterium]